jgi:hypothetical protein
MEDKKTTVVGHFYRFFGHIEMIKSLDYSSKEIIKEI